MAKKVLVLVNQLQGRPAPYLDRLRKAGFEIVFSGLDRLAKEDELIKMIPGIFATMAGGEPYTEKVFDAAKDLKLVARFGVGYDQVNVPAATRHKVPVAMAFGSNHESVADGAFTLLSATACNLPWQSNLVRAGGWAVDFHPGIWKKTLGIIGIGRIGKALARRAGRGFDMKILAYDPKPDVAWAKENNIELVDIKTLLNNSDFVSLHIPHVKENENFMNAEKFAMMKPSAFLINTARGALVDEDALLAALKNKTIAGAGLDVFKKEPPVGSPLLKLENVVFLPHTSGMDDTGEAAMANKCIDSIIAISEGEHPGEEFVLNPEALPPGLKPARKWR
jgi:D-3-phosphoglycerate dehydrogenase